FARDHLESVSDVTDGSATLLAHYAFDPYGRRTLTAGSGSTGVGYTGHESNVQVGIDLTMYRAYDPALGRWISEDRLQLVEGPNMYLYAADNPLAYIDALGLKIICAMHSIKAARNVKHTRCPRDPDGVQTIRKRLVATISMRALASRTGV